MRLLITLLLSFILISCSTRYLSSRGTFSEDREGYIRANWNKADEEIKNTFIDKMICVGMHRRMVMASFGPPDNNIDSSTWIYTLSSGRKGTVDFEKDIAVEITENLLGNPKVGNDY